MLEIDISDQIDEAIQALGDIFKTQIPFVTAQALNDTGFDGRRRIVESTWANSFDVRNTRFAGRSFRVLKKATKADLAAIVGGQFAYPWVEQWVMNQTSGGKKTSVKGGLIAVPVAPKRNGGGSIRNSAKPLSLKNTYIRGGTGGTKLLFQRVNKTTTVLRYVLVPQAQIRPTFRFYEDMEVTTLRVFSGHWNNRMTVAIRQSRIFSGV